jgi:transmembrane sensor
VASRAFPAELSDEEHAALWADLAAAGEMREEDERALQRWLVEDPRRTALYETHRRLLAEPAFTARRVAAHGERLRPQPKAARMPSARSTRAFVDRGAKYAWAGALAAAFALVVVVLGGIIPNRGMTHDVSEREFVTQAGILQLIRLPDGSEVHMNGGTLLHVRMSESARDLQLIRGEAFFTVAHDAARPFSVHVAQGRVVAVGTAFNVNALAAVTEVSVSEGVVRLESDVAGPPFRLAVGERAVIGDGGAVSRLPRLPSGDAAGWRSGWLEVEDAPLAEVLEAINRATSKPVRLADPSLEYPRVTGRYNLRRPGDTLKALSRTLNLELVEDGSGQYAVRAEQRVKLK